MRRDIERRISVVMKLFEKEPELRDEWIRASLEDFFVDSLTDSYEEDLRAVVTCFAPHSYEKHNEKIWWLCGVLTNIGQRLDDEYGE